jgi:hypothetical protein
VINNTPMRASGFIVVSLYSKLRECRMRYHVAARN